MKTGLVGLGEGLGFGPVGAGIRPFVPEPVDGDECGLGLGVGHGRDEFLDLQDHLVEVESFVVMT